MYSNGPATINREQASHLPRGQIVEFAERIEGPIVKVRPHKGSNSMNALEDPERGELNDAFAQACLADAQFARKISFSRQAASWLQFAAHGECAQVVSDLHGERRTFGDGAPPKPFSNIRERPLFRRQQWSSSKQYILRIDATGRDGLSLVLSRLAWPH